MPALMDKKAGPGRPRKDEHPVQFSVRLSKELNAALVACVEATRPTTSRNGVIVDALEQYLKEKGYLEG